MGLGEMAFENVFQILVNAVNEPINSILLNLNIA